MRIVDGADVPLAAWQALSETALGWPRSEAFLRWRLSPGRSVTRAVLRDGRVVALLSAFPRRYRIGASIQTVYETMDWHAEPGAGPAGLLVMQALLKDGAPLLSVGGSDQNRALLPRLGFRVAGSVRTFRLPLGAGPFARRFGTGPLGLAVSAAGAKLAALWWLPRAVAYRAPAGVKPFDVPPDGLSALYEPPGDAADFVQLPDRRHHDWLFREMPTPPRGVFVGLERDGRLAGWAEGRAWEAGGRSRAVIADAFLREPDVKGYRDLLGTLGAALARTGADEIAAAASAAPVAEALRTLGYLEGATMPIFLHPAGRVDLQIQHPHLGMSRGDDGLLPYADPTQRP